MPQLYIWILSLVNKCNKIPAQRLYLFAGKQEIPYRKRGDLSLKAKFDTCIIKETKVIAFIYHS